MAEIEVQRPNEDELERLGVRGWPIWEKETSTFDWHYDDPETCFILAGKVRVEPKDDREAVVIGPGDLVTFPRDLSCVWTVSEKVRKHYRFG